MNVFFQILSIAAWLLVLYSLIIDFVRINPPTRSHKKYMFTIVMLAFAITTTINIHGHFKAKRETRIAQTEKQKAEEERDALKLEIEEIRPLPLKIRIQNLLDVIDPQIRPFIVKNGSSPASGHIDLFDLRKMKALIKEDGGKHLKLLPTTTVSHGIWSDGSNRKFIRFWVSHEIYTP